MEQLAQPGLEKNLEVLLVWKDRIRGSIQSIFVEGVGDDSQQIAQRRLDILEQPVSYRTAFGGGLNAQPPRHIHHRPQIGDDPPPLAVRSDSIRARFA